jgi:hypothetical protein
MHSSPRQGTGKGWLREWEDEQELTREEQKEADRLKRIEDAQTAQILEDIRMIRLEEEHQEEKRKSDLLSAKGYLKDCGWSDAAIWALSDDEVLEAAETEAVYAEEVYDFYGDEGDPR